jgi:cytochrome c-type biogenesis protein CcmH/NrfG
VIEVLGPQRGSSAAALPVEDAAPHVARSAAALAERRFEEALAAAREGIVADPGNADARLAAARALLRLGRAADATEELRRAAQADPLHPEVQFELGFAAARRGDLAGAVASWEHYLRMAPHAEHAEHAEQARTARDAAVRMQRILEAHADA